MRVTSSCIWLLSKLDILNSSQPANINSSVSSVLVKPREGKVLLPVSQRHMMIVSSFSVHYNVASCYPVACSMSVCGASLSDCELPLHTVFVH